MDDIYEYIKMDHRKVDKLFELYESAPTDRNKVEIVAALNKELTVHAKAEEATFYKAILQHRQGDKEVMHGEKEHQEITDKLNEILALQQVDATMDKLVEELKKLVKHHVSEEEGDIFKEAKEVLSKEEAFVVKEQMHFLKGKLILENFAD